MHDHSYLVFFAKKKTVVFHLFIQLFDYNCIDIFRAVGNFFFSFLVEKKLNFAPSNCLLNSIICALRGREAPNINWFIVNGTQLLSATQLWSAVQNNTIQHNAPIFQYATNLFGTHMNYEVRLPV